jgi:hypothetical protein
LNGKFDDNGMTSEQRRDPMLSKRRLIIVLIFACVALATFVLWPMRPPPERDWSQTQPQAEDRPLRPVDLTDRSAVEVAPFGSASGDEFPRERWSPARGEPLRVSGTIDVSGMEKLYPAPTTVGVWFSKRDKDGRRVFYAGDVGRTVDRGGGRLEFDVPIQAPRIPGRYEVEVKVGGVHRVGTAEYVVPETPRP